MKIVLMIINEVIQVNDKFMDLLLSESFLHCSFLKCTPDGLAASDAPDALHRRVWDGSRKDIDKLLDPYLLSMDLLFQQTSLFL